MFTSQNHYRGQVRKNKPGRHKYNPETMST
jgi:hypothetical protein